MEDENTSTTDTTEVPVSMEEAFDNFTSESDIVTELEVNEEDDSVGEGNKGEVKEEGSADSATDEGKTLEGEAPTEEVAIVQESGDVSEIGTLKGQIEALTQLVNTLSAPKSVEAPIVPNVNLKDLVDNTDFDEIMESKEKFMEFISKALLSASTATVNHIQGVVPSILNQQQSMAEVRKQFYDSYPELLPVSKFVGNVANDIAEKNPDWSVAQVLQESAKVSKKALNIPDSIKPTGEKARPTLPGGSNASRGGEIKKSALQAQLDDFASD